MCVVHQASIGFSDNNDDVAVATATAEEPAVEIPLEESFFFNDNELFILPLCRIRIFDDSLQDLASVESCCSILLL